MKAKWLIEETIFEDNEKFQQELLKQKIEFDLIKYIHLKKLKDFQYNN